MAHEYTSWAYSLEIPGAGRKFVLVALADAANADGYSFPGQKRLATMTGQSERTVRAHLEWLESNGYIKRVERRRKDGTRTSDEYHLPPMDSTGSIRRLFTTGNSRRLMEERINADQGTTTPGPATGETRRLSASRSTGNLSTSHRQISPVDAEPTSAPSSTAQTPSYQPADFAGHEPLTTRRTLTPLPPKGGSGAKAPRSRKGKGRSKKQHEFNPHDPNLGLPDNFDPTLFADFCDRLLEINKPMTLLALRHFVEAHKHHPAAELDEMFRRSIRAGWPDLYPLNKPSNGTPPPPKQPKPKTAADDWRELLRIHSSGHWNANTLSDAGKTALQAIGGWTAIYADDPTELEIARQMFIQHHDEALQLEGTP